MLKPGGALAAWCYSLPLIKDCTRANKFFNEFWETKLGPHKAHAHIIWERQYRGFEPGEGDFGVVKRVTQTFEQKSSIWHLVRLQCSCAQQMRCAAPCSMCVYYVEKQSISFQAVCCKVSQLLTGMQAFHSQVHFNTELTDDLRELWGMLLYRWHLSGHQACMGRW